MSADRPKSSEEEPARDVLAAEAFAVPAPDPNLRHQDLELPEDPSGIQAPHDILAAEEFAMPAVATPPAPGTSPGAVRARRTAMSAAAGLLALIGLRRARR
jgi:hypothetical protein